MAETSDQDGQTMSSPGGKPVVLITGAAGSIGRALCDALTDRYDVVGLDIECDGTDFPCLEMDITNPASVELALTKVAEQFGTSFAAVIHLAAYFDFTGKDHPMYQAVNVDGTRHLVRALQHYTVERFIYSGTMLVHEPVKPGELITEEQPIAPKWAYPQSKAAAEEVIRNEAGDMPYTLLHLAGLYDDKTAVPTLSNQIARIYERELKSHVYAGDFSAGQSMLHREDMINAMQRVVDRRQELPEQTTILIGEPEGVSYERLQERIGNLIHGEKEWRTISLPQPLAKLGSAVEVASEPVVPDAIDDGEKPFIRPFMIDMAEDHYALDIARARDLLGWEPKHNLHDDLESLIAACRKWIDFTDRRAAMIVARDGHAKWGRASKAALKSGIFVRSGMPIPDDALAAIGAAERGFVSDRPVARPNGVWNFSRGSEPVRELAMVSEFLDMSLTILQFDDAFDVCEIEEDTPWDAYDQFTRDDSM